MAKQERLTMQQVLDEIFMDPLREDEEEHHLEEDYSDFTQYLSELTKKFQMKWLIHVTSTQF